MFSLIFILLFFVANFQKNNLCELSFSQEGTYVLYVSGDNFIDDNNSQVIKNGNGYVVKTNQQNAKKLLKSSYEISGEAIEFKDVSVQNLLNEITSKLEIKVVGYEYLEGVTVINCYSKILEYFIIINNQKVNLQIAHNKNDVTIGYPLILHSF